VSDGRQPGLDPELDRELRRILPAAQILDRTEELVPTGAASAEDRERHRASLDVAQATVVKAKQELARLRAGFRAEEVAKARLKMILGAVGYASIAGFVALLLTD